MEIQGFSSYIYVDGNIIRCTDCKIMPMYLSTRGDQFYKLKNDNNKFINIRKNTIMALSGDTISMHPTARAIPNTDNKYFIDHFGNIYSFYLNKRGILMVPYTNRSGYPSVTIVFDGKKVYKDVHALMCHTFILKDYTKEGLVCMHIDNNKLNCVIENLKVGTYSENNQQAYDDGINPRKKTICEVLAQEEY